MCIRDSYISDSFFVGATSVEEFDPITAPTGDLTQDSFVTLDLNVSLLSLVNGWRVSLIATNLTDEQIFNFSGPPPFIPAGGDDLLVGFRRGRQFFVEAALNF